MSVGSMTCIARMWTALECDYFSPGEIPYYEHFFESNFPKYSLGSEI